MRKTLFSPTFLKLSIVGLTAAIAFFGFYDKFGFQPRTTANSSGPPTAHTGAPGENSCINCHGDFAANSGVGRVRIAGLPVNYTPSKTYPVTVTVNEPNAVLFGFQSVSLDNQNGQAGNFAIPAASPSASPQMQIVNGIVGGAQRRYIEHTRAGTAPPAGTFSTRSWTYNWTAPPSKRGKITLYTASNGANGDGGTSGDYIYTTSAGACSGTVQANFDSDNRADIAVFRPSNGIWYRLNPADNSFIAQNFGVAGDRLVPGDFDGDGRNDFAVWRPSNGAWYILNSSNNQVRIEIFGVSTDTPLVGDYTGDGKTDLAVFRPSNGIWYIWDLAANQYIYKTWGGIGDIPVAGDYDGDGKNDFAVYRPSEKIWYIENSSNNAVRIERFGLSEDKPVSGDFDGDGKTDIALYRPSAGDWYRLNSSNNQFVGFDWGVAGDVPAPNDYDGDCKTDFAVYRSGVWYIHNSANAAVTIYNFGLNSDVPIASIYASAQPSQSPIAQKRAR